MTEVFSSDRIVTGLQPAAMPLVTAGLNRNSIHAEEYPMNHRLNKDRIETLHAARFLNLYDLQYAEGKHYFEASRRGKNDLVVRMKKSAGCCRMP